MTTHISGIAGDRNPLATCTGCESLDALGKEMFQAPGLLELERTLERHPHYPLLKLKEQMARRPAFMLRSGVVSLESTDNVLNVRVGAGATSRSGGGERSLGLAGAAPRLLPERDGSRKRTAVVCHKRLQRGATWRAPSPGAGPAATTGKTRVVIEDCEELMLLMAKRNSEVPKISARKIEQLMLEMFAEEIGKENCFTYRTIQDTVLYGMWREALKKARHDVDLEDLGDALDTGLEISALKHGRSDRRTEYSPQQEAAIRSWKRDAQNASAQAAHRVEDRKRGR